MTPWWAREVSCPTCAAEPGRSCVGAEAHLDRVEAALVALTTRVASMRVAAGQEQPPSPRVAALLGNLSPDKRAAALDRLDAAIISARAWLAALASGDDDDE